VLLGCTGVPISPIQVRYRPHRNFSEIPRNIDGSRMNNTNITLQEDHVIHDQHEVKVPGELAERAHLPIECMLSFA